MEKEKNKKRKIYLIAVFLIIIVVIISIAIPLTNNKNEPDPIKITKQNNGLPKLENFETLFEIAKKSENNNRIYVLEDGIAKVDKWLELAKKFGTKCTLVEE